MKNLKCKIASLSIIVLALMSIGCTDFTEPNYVPEFPWTTVDQFEMAVLVPYSVGQGGWSNTIGIQSFYEMLATDMASVVEQATPNNEWIHFVNRDHRSTAHEALNWIGSSYPNIFRAIAGSNEGLSFLDSDDPYNLFPKDTKEKVDANIPRAKAELLFWRAISYYWGILLYTPPYVPGGANADQILPLKIVNANAANTPIGTTQEVIDQILSDLKEAKSNMPKDYYRSGRINYWTICGLLARVYFLTGDHANAERECTEIINNYAPRMPLPADPLEAWKVQYGEYSEPVNEVIWMFNSNQADHQNYSWTVVSRASPWQENYGRGENSEITWNACKLSNAMIKKLGWMVDPENGDFTETELARVDKRYGRHGLQRDLTSTWWRVEPFKAKDAVLAEIEATGDETLWDKYEQHHDKEVSPLIYLDKYFRSRNGARQCQPQMRVPEFYIMRAAIRFRNNDKTGAAADLKVVRDRAGLTGEWEITAANITENDIDREHVIELGGESLWFLYTIAMQKPIMPGDRKGVAPVNPPYTGWYWKMPITEINMNAGYVGIPDPNAK